MSEKHKNILLNSILGFLASILLGILIVGIKVFDYKSHAFQITSFSITGSIFFSVYKYGTKREIIFAGLILFISILILIGKPITIIYLTRDIGFTTSLFLSLILYCHFLKKYFYAPMFIRALALSLFLGILNILATLFLIILFDTPTSESIRGIMLNGKYGVIIGLGLGIGFDVFLKFKKNLINFLKL